MRDLLKLLILEFHQAQLPIPVPRQIHFQIFPENIRKVQVFMGMRRTGKTWLMYQHIHAQLQAQVPKEKLLYLNFEDDRLLSFKSENFTDIITAYFDLYPQFAHDKEVVFYFDAIHLIPGWESFVRRLLDKEKMSIFITGSSAKMLSKEIATNLRGRAISTEVFPFHFSEYLSFQQIDPTLVLTSKNQSLLRYHCQHYLSHGGFPETLFIEPDRYRDLLQSYVNSVIFRDIIDRYKIANTTVLKMFLFFCLQNISAPLSITKKFNDLKSQGASISKNTLYEYVEYFQDAYLIFFIPIYDLSLRKRQINPKKIYTVDPGILSAYSINPHFNQGPALENATFLELRRQYADIYYYKTKNNKEIDFVVLSETGMLSLYQCCFDMSAQKTYEREISALLEAAVELKTSSLFIITGDLEKTLQHKELTIHIIPFWKWTLKIKNLQ